MRWFINSDRLCLCTPSTIYILGLQGNVTVVMWSRKGTLPRQSVPWVPHFITFPTHSHPFPTFLPEQHSTLEKASPEEAATDAEVPKVNMEAVGGWLVEGSLRFMPHADKIGIDQNRSDICIIPHASIFPFLQFHAGGFQAGSTERLYWYLRRVGRAQGARTVKPF